MSPVEDEQLVLQIAKKIHLLHISKSRNHTPIYEWDNLRTSHKQNLLLTATITLLCVYANIPEDDSVSIIHNNWLSRNYKVSTQLQQKSFCLLSEFEKVRYRNIFRIAFDLYKQDISYIS